MCAEQLPLDFNFRPSLEEDDFWVAPCNERAVKWLDQWPDWPSPFLLIHGPKGCGKTHLVEVFKKATHAPTIPLDPDPYAVMAGKKIAVLEDLCALSDQEQRDLFHLFNSVRENGQTVLLTARSPHTDWDISLKDLSSRLSTMISVEITQPDDRLLEALIAKQCRDRQLHMEHEVIRYVLSRIERSYEAVGQIVADIDGYALKHKKKISVALVRQLLQDRAQPDLLGPVR